MRVIPIEIEIERWKQGNTFQVQIVHFDWADGDSCLFGAGWYQGKFWVEFCFWSAIKTLLL